MKLLVCTIVAAVAAVAAFALNATGQGGKPTPFPPDEVGPVNRYQLLHIQEASETTLWMLDTTTGRIWRRYAYPDGDHWTQTVREDYPSAYLRLDGMPPKPPTTK